MLFAMLLLLAQEPTIDQTLRQLDDESPEVRDRASAWIYGRGEDAVPELRKALAGAGPEVRGRIERLIYRIEWEPLVPVSLLARLPEARAAFHRGDHAGFLQLLVARPSWEHGGAEEVEAYAVRLLRSPDAELALAGVEILELIGRERDAVVRRPVGPIVDFLCRWNPGEWDDRARQKLALIGEVIHRRATPRDLRILRDAKAENPNVDRLLGMLRAGIGDAGSTPLLLQALSSDESSWRYLALQTAEKSGCKAAAPAVAKLLDSKQVSWEAWKAMEKVYDPSTGGLVVEAARRIPPAERSGDALRLLASIGTPEALALVRESLAIENLQYWAATFLADRGDYSGLDVLLGELSKKSGGSCAMVAARMVDGKSVDRYLRLMDEPETPARYPVAYSVRLITEPEARRKTVLRFEQERHPEVRRIMLEAMAGWSTDLGEPIEKLARDLRDPLASTAAVLAVRDRGARGLPLVESLLDQGVPFQPRTLGNLLELAPPRLLVRLGRSPGFQSTDCVIARLEELGAKAELAELIGVENWRAVAATALLRLGGDPGEYLKAHPEEIFWGELDDAARRDVPGVRDLLRARMKAGLLDEYSLQAFRFWALPEMLPVLRKRLGQHDATRGAEVGDPQAPEFCAMTLAGRNWGFDALSAISATGDPASLPLLLERLNDPESGMQATAMRALARRKAKEAVPILRQIVLSSRSWIRGKALLALGEIGAPGTAEFLRAQLRDNPATGPAALARLGVDARDEVRALLEDGASPAPVLGAVDFMAHREVYAALDAPLIRRYAVSLEDLRAAVERATGRPCRISPKVTERGSDTSQEGETIRERLEGFERIDGITHVFRDGVILLCLAEEAR